MKEKVEFLWLIPEEQRNVEKPSYETDGSAGMDVAACLDESLTVLPGDIALIPTGFALAIPVGFEIQVRPRSGLAIKKGLTIVNSPGTIDSDYRGEVKIGLINLGSEDVVIERGDRIAQLVLAPVVQAQFVEVDELDKTERGAGGFGHTGV